MAEDCNDENLSDLIRALLDKIEKLVGGRSSGCGCDGDSKGVPPKLFIIMEPDGRAKKFSLAVKILDLGELQAGAPLTSESIMLHSLQQTFDDPSMQDKMPKVMSAPTNITATDKGKCIASCLMSK